MKNMTQGGGGGGGAGVKLYISLWITVRKKRQAKFKLLPVKPREKSIVNSRENENRVNDLKTFESIPTLLLSNRLMKAWNREIYDSVALAKVNSSENV